jgi:hypothetical protein
MQGSCIGLCGGFADSTSKLNKNAFLTLLVLAAVFFNGATAAF